jgi:hypothetical protein
MGQLILLGSGRQAWARRDGTLKPIVSDAPGTSGLAFPSTVTIWLTPPQRVALDRGR